MSDHPGSDPSDPSLSSPPPLDREDPTRTQAFEAPGDARPATAPPVTPPPPPPAPTAPTASQVDPPPAPPTASERAEAPAPPAHSYRGWGGRLDAGGRAAGGPRVTRIFDDHLKDESAWTLGSASLLLALAFYWVDSFLSGFQHAPGLTGQERVFSFLVPGTFLWAFATMVAVALYSAGQRFELSPAEPTAIRRALPRFLLAACVISAAAAALDMVVELANIGHGIDRAFSGLLGYLGVVILSAASAWWAYRDHRPDRGGRTLDREHAGLA